MENLIFQWKQQNKEKARVSETREEEAAENLAEEEEEQEKRALDEF